MTVIVTSAAPSGSRACEDEEPVADDCDVEAPVDEAEEPALPEDAEADICELAEAEADAGELADAGEPVDADKPALETAVGRASVIDAAPSFGSAWVSTPSVTALASSLPFVWANAENGAIAYTVSRQSATLKMFLNLIRRMTIILSARTKKQVII